MSEVAKIASAIAAFVVAMLLIILLAAVANHNDRLLILERMHGMNPPKPVVPVHPAAHTEGAK